MRDEIAIQVARFLLQSKAIKLEPANPFTWASGWKSPIYCDNRITLSYPEVRNYIKEAFCRIIRTEYPEVELIAGVATGGISQGALVAGELDLPFIYVRATPKSHGLENLIEGLVQPGKKVVVIEDLISTGGSSLKAVDAIREAGMKVEGMCAVFTYGFKVAEESFRNKDCRLATLSNYSVLIEEAVQSGYIKEEQIEQLSKWRLDPGNWKA
jgi:orotate phosphoribosyltransferase